MTSIAQTRRQRQARTYNVVKTSMGIIYSHQARKMSMKRIWEEVEQILMKNSRMRRASIAAQKRHAKAYAPIHRELEFLWSSMRTSRYLIVDN